MPMAAIARKAANGIPKSRFANYRASTFSIEEDSTPAVDRSKHEWRGDGPARDKKRAGQARHQPIMQIEARRIALRENYLGARQFLGRAMNDYEKSVRLHRLFILNHAVSRNAGAIQRGAERAEAADHDSAFDRGNDDRSE